MTFQPDRTRPLLLSPRRTCAVAGFLPAVLPGQPAAVCGLVTSAAWQLKLDGSVKTNVSFPVDVLELQEKTPGTSVSLGADPSCDITIDRDTVSSKHALVKVSEAGALIITPLAR